VSVFYSVGNKKFTHKIESIMYSMKTKEPITWNFHKEVFEKIDWTHEPDIPLDKFYKIRARQIREQYDYVVILCSGGADSTNVVKSFLDNGIKVDEIIASAPLSGLRDFKFNNKDTSHNNTMSETVYAQMPLIKEIASFFPEVKITVNDYFEDILSYDSEEWIYSCEDWLHPSSSARYYFEKHKHLKKLVESGKRLAFVYGIDKPVLIKWHNDNVFFIFSDLTVNVQRPPFKMVYPNVDNVLFYWAHDLPQMIVKQAHTVLKWIYDPQNMKALSFMYDIRYHENEQWKDQRARHSKYERAIIPAIYPNTYRKVFQAEKPESLFLGEHDNWFYKHHHSTRSYDIMVNDIKKFFKKIDPKYLNKGNNGFNLFFNWYKIGSINNYYNSNYISRI
jgi:hypothetical protein